MQREEEGRRTELGMKKKENRRRTMNAERRGREKD